MLAQVSPLQEIVDSLAFNILFADVSSDGVLSKERFEPVANLVSVLDNDQFIDFEKRPQQINRSCSYISLFFCSQFYQALILGTQFKIFRPYTCPPGDNENAGLLNLCLPCEMQKFLSLKMKF